MARRERNRVVVAVVAVLILAAGIYGPVALLAPLPQTPGISEAPTMPTVVDPAGGPVLPASGSSAVTLSADDQAITAGSTDPIPMAAATKIVTALVVLDEHPLEAGRSGPLVPVTADDFASYSRYQAEGTRAVRVVTGDEWSEREALQAMLIASSNNHAEMLARWAFGSLDNYLTAAGEWLAENDFAATTVADTTGLSAESVSTGADLARLSAMAMADPLLAEIVATDTVTTLRNASFENTISYRAAEGITGISRSYTDEAGVCLLFATTVDIEGQPVTVYGAMIGEPSYDSLDTDMSALMASLPSAVAARTLVTAGESYGTYRTAWGAEASALAREDAVGVGWVASDASAALDVRLDDVTTARRGVTVGSIAVEGLEGRQTVVLELSSGIGDPGPLWRLFNPGVVVPAFIQMLSG